MKLDLKFSHLLLGIVLSIPAPANTPEEVLAEHRAGSGKVAEQQDELAADVQQLTIEQTLPHVIKLFNEVGTIMDEVTDKLAATETGGETLAAQAEVIEKIYAAAKAKQPKSGAGSPSGAMMEMMERMMGKKPEGEQPGKGGAPGDQAGKGSGGDSNAANTPVDGQASGKSEARRVPKASGSAGQMLPEEFQKVLDAYNRGAERKVK